MGNREYQQYLYKFKLDTSEKTGKRQDKGTVIQAPTYCVPRFAEIISPSNSTSITLRINEAEAALESKNSSSSRFPLPEELQRTAGAVLHKTAYNLSLLNSIWLSCLWLVLVFFLQHLSFSINVNILSYGNIHKKSLARLKLNPILHLQFRTELKILIPQFW